MKRTTLFLWSLIVLMIILLATGWLDVQVFPEWRTILIQIGD